MAALAAPRMHAFNPGQSPPAVRMPMVLVFDFTVLPPRRDARPLCVSYQANPRVWHALGLMAEIVSLGQKASVADAPVAKAGFCSLSARSLPCPALAGARTRRRHAPMIDSSLAARPSGRRACAKARALLRVREAPFPALTPTEAACPGDGVVSRCAFFIPGKVFLLAMCFSEATNKVGS